MLVKAGAGGFRLHRIRGWLERNQNTDGGLLVIQHAAQISHVLHAGLAALDLNDDLLRLRRFRVVAEENLAVNAVVGAFLLFFGPGAHEPQRPSLELELVFFGERGGFVRRRRFADDVHDGR